jgi:hypothetical protein
MADYRAVRRLAGLAAAIAAVLALGPFAASAPAKLRVATGTTSLTVKGAVGTAQANCPRGTVAVSGGFGQSPTASFTNNQYVNVFSSHRQGARAWTVSAVEYGTKPATLTAYAYCGVGKRPRQVVKSFPLLAAPRYEAAAVATCKSGTQPVSGGFTLPQPVPGGTSVFLTQMQIFGKHQWLVKGVRSSTPASADGVVTAYAYCIKGKRPRAKTKTVTELSKISPPAPFAVDTDPCSHGTRPIAGGLRGPYTQMGPNRGIPSVTDSLLIGKAWRVDALAFAGGVDDIPISFTAIVYCR